MEFRIARHTHNIEKIIDFYTKIIGFDVIGEFTNHDGYDGIFIGIKGESWQLEFTQSDDAPEHQFDPDDLLVFYPSTQEEFERIKEAIVLNTVKLHTPKNPYWKENGIGIHDPDGYGVIISPLRINK